MDGPNDEGRKFKQVQKVDGPHKGSRLQSTIWTDPMTRIIKQVHKVDGPNKWSILESTTWTDPTKGNTQIHNMDGFHEGSRSKSIKWTDPTNCQKSCPQRVKIPVHIVDGPHKDENF